MEYRRKFCREREERGREGEREGGGGRETERGVEKKEETQLYTFVCS